MTRLDMRVDHYVKNARILLFGADLKLTGNYIWVYNSLQWSLWDGNPDLYGEIVLILDKGLNIELTPDGNFEVTPPHNSLHPIQNDERQQS